MPCQVAGDGALSRSGRAVDGDDDFLGRQVRAVGRDIHPRFFDPCLDRVARPNRLPPPAFELAASAGFLLLPKRAGRVSVRESFRGGAPGLPAVLAPLEWTLRWPPLRGVHAGAADLAERVPEAEGRAAGLPFPLEPFPRAEPAPGRAPLCLPLAPAAAFWLQRAAEAGPVPLAGRDSAARRT